MLVLAAALAALGSTPPLPPADCFALLYTWVQPRGPTTCGAACASRNLTCSPRGLVEFTKAQAGDCGAAVGAGDCASLAGVLCPCFAASKHVTMYYDG